MEYYHSTWNLLSDPGSRLLLAKHTVRELYSFKYGFDDSILLDTMLRPGAGAFRRVSLDRAQEHWEERVGAFSLDRFLLSGHVTQIVLDVERSGSPEEGRRIFSDAKEDFCFRSGVYGVENALFLAFALGMHWPHLLGVEAYCTLARELIYPEILGSKQLEFMLAVALPGSTLRLDNGPYVLRQETEVTYNINLEGGSGSSTIQLEANLTFAVAVRIQNVVFVNRTERALELQVRGSGWKGGFALINVSCLGVTVRANCCQQLYIKGLHVSDALVGLRAFQVGKLVLDGDPVYKSLITRCQRAFYIYGSETVTLSHTVVQYAEEVFDVHVKGEFQASRCTFQLSLHLGEIRMPEGWLPTFAGTTIAVMNDALDVGPDCATPRILPAMNTEPRRPFTDEAMRRAFGELYSPDRIRPERAAALLERLTSPLPEGPAELVDTTGGTRIPKRSSFEREPEYDLFFRALQDGPGVRVRAVDWYIGQVVSPPKMLSHKQEAAPAIDEKLLAHETESLADRIHAWRLQAWPPPAVEVEPTMGEGGRNEQEAALAWAVGRERQILHLECLEMARASLKPASALHD